MTDSAGSPVLNALPETPPLATAGEAVWLKAADDLRLRAAFWNVPVTPAGTVLLLQGRAEFIEKYDEVIAELIARNFAVAAFDWRGQGGSERQLRNRSKGHVEDFDDYGLDLDAMVAEMIRRDLPKPWTILAHSTGAAIALLYLARGPSPFMRAVLTAPLIGIAGKGGSTTAKLAARSLASIGLAHAFVPGGTRGRSLVEGPFETNPFTQDPVRYARMQAWRREHPHLSVGDPTIGWVAAAFDALARFEAPDFGEASRTPVLMLLAGADSIVSTRAADALARRLRSASAIILNGSRHEILMERNEIRRLFWEAFDAFATRAPAPEASTPETAATS